MVNIMLANILNDIFKFFFTYSTTNVTSKSRKLLTRGLVKYCQKNIQPRKCGIHKYENVEYVSTQKKVNVTTPPSKDNTPIF